MPTVKYLFIRPNVIALTIGPTMGELEARVNTWPFWCTVLMDRAAVRALEVNDPVAYLIAEFLRRWTNLANN